MAYRRDISKRGYILENIDFQKIRWDWIILSISLILILLYFTVPFFNGISLTTTGKVVLNEEKIESVAHMNFVIEIINAEHLDENRKFIAEIGDDVKSLDGAWSKEIPSEDYVRVVFERKLDNTRDITIYPRIVSGNPRIEVYEFKGTEIIAEFTNLNDKKYNKIFLTNLQGIQDTFDLRVLDGSVEFDHIIDPVFFSDDFDDNSFDTSKWVEFNHDAGGDITEQNQRLEKLLTTGYAHTGTSAYTVNNFSTTGYYSISYNYYDAMSGNENGFDGLWIENASHVADHVNYDDSNYGGLHCGIFYSISYDGTVDICGQADCVSIASQSSSCNSWAGDWANHVYINDTVGVISQGTWYFIKVTINWTSNYTEIYVDDKLTANGTIDSSDVSAIGDYFKVEWHESDYNKAGGSYIDNVTIDDSIPAGEGDTTDPTVTLNSPANNANLTSQSVTFNGTASDDVNLENVTLYGNWTGSWTANETNSSPINNTPTVFSKTIPEGKGHIWNYYACDNSSNCVFASSNRIFTVDTTGPSLSNENVNDTSININEYFCVNITATDSIAGLDVVLAEIYNTTAFVNYTMTDTGSTSCDSASGDDVYGAEIQGTAAGTWNYSKVWANDTFGNSNTYDFVDLTVNVSIPDLPPEWQDDSTNSTFAGEPIEHRVNWTDDNALSGYIFSFDNGTGSFINDSFVAMIGTQNWSNVTKTVNSTAGTTIRWRVYVNDSANQWGETDIFSYVTIETCSLPSTFTIISDSITNITIQLDNCYKASFRKPQGETYSASSPRTLLYHLNVWNGSEYSINHAFDQTGETGYYYALGFLEHYDWWKDNPFGGDDGWRVFNWLNGSLIDYELVMDTSQMKIIRFNGTENDNNMKWETLWVMRDDWDFIRAYHKKTYVDGSYGTQDQIAWMWDNDPFDGPGDKVFITNETGARFEDSMTDDNSIPYWKLFTATDLGFMNRFPFLSHYDSQSNTSSGLIALYAENPLQSKTMDWSFDTGDLMGGTEPQVSWMGASGTVRNANDQAIFDSLIFVGVGEYQDNKTASEWFSPYSKTFDVDTNVRSGKRLEGSIETIGLWSIYMKLFECPDECAGSSMGGGSAKKWAVYPLSYSSKEGANDSRPENVETRQVFDITLKMVNSSGTFEKNDTTPEYLNDAEMSYVNNVFDDGNNNGNINFTIWNDSDKLQVFANISIGPIAATEIYVELNYSVSFGIDYYKDMDVVQLNITTYDLRWYDSALGWIGTIVYGTENVVNITDTGNSLRIYLLNDTSTHDNEDFNIMFWIWNHEGNKTLSNITGLHQKAPVTYNQHYIKMNKSDDRFGILEFGEMAIINYSYYNESNITMYWWGLADTEQNYTLYYNVSGRLVNNVTADGVELFTWSYDTTSKELTMTVDYTGDDVKEILINENIHIIDTTSPEWRDDSTNSTFAGEPIEHRVNWTDDNALSGYIFSFDNGTGSFINDSFVAMIGTQNWSNVTKVVNSTVGSTIRWRVYANDTSDNQNVTDIFTYETTLPPDTIYPQFSSFTENPPNNSAYIFGQNYQFNVTLVNTNGTTGLDINGTNYSATNDSINNFYVTINSLSAGTYDYYWWSYGNGSSNNFNASAIRAYTIRQAVPAGSLTNDTILTREYDGGATTIGISESNSGDGDLTYTIYRDNVNVGSSDTEAAAGTYDYVLNTTGGQNYTANASMDSFTLTISQNTTYTLTLTITPSTSETYGTETTATGSNCPAQLTCNSYREGLSVSNPEIITLAAGTYNYTYNTTGNANYSSNGVSDNLTINQNTGSCNVLFNDTSPVTYLETFIVWSNCTSGFILYRNGTTISNNSVQSLAASSYNFTVIRNDSANYTNIYDEQTFFINQVTGVVFTYVNHSRANKTIEQFTEIYLNSTLETGTGNIKLYDNGTLINQGTSPLSNLTNFTGIGPYNITTIYDGNTNYTPAYETWWVNVNEAEETPGEVSTPSGGRGAKREVYECSQDSECSDDETCLDNQCVKLFDIKIIDFESPVKVGEFFDFTYFLKGMAQIEDDVRVEFWIEKEGKKITSGSDVIYFGSFEEKTETTKIFLPKEVESGIYEFFVSVSYGSYSTYSQRTIEIEVRDDILAGITTPKEFNIPLPILIAIILILIFLTRTRIKSKRRQRKRDDLKSMFRRINMKADVSRELSEILSLGKEREIEDKKLPQIKIPKRPEIKPVPMKSKIKIPPVRPLPDIEPVKEKPEIKIPPSRPLPKIKPVKEKPRKQIDIIQDMVNKEMREKPLKQIQKPEIRQIQKPPLEQYQKLPMKKFEKEKYFVIKPPKKSEIKEITPEVKIIPKEKPVIKPVQKHVERSRRIPLLERLEREIKQESAQRPKKIEEKPLKQIQKSRTNDIKQKNEKSEEELFTIIDDLNKKQPEAGTKPNETANIIRDIVEKEKRG